MNVAMVDDDDGITLTLLVPTRFYRDQLTEHFLKGLEHTLSRKIVFKIDGMAGRGANNRKTRPDEMGPNAPTA